MIKYTTHLTNEQIERLKAIKKEIGVPVGEQIRRAVDEYLEKESPGSNQR